MGEQTKLVHDHSEKVHSLHKPAVHVYGGLPLNECHVRLKEDVVFVVDMLPVERGRLVLSASWKVSNARRPACEIIATTSAKIPPVANTYTPLLQGTLQEVGYNRP